MSVWRPSDKCQSFSPSRAERAKVKERESWKFQGESLARSGGKEGDPISLGIAPVVVDSRAPQERKRMKEQQESKKNASAKEQQQQQQSKTPKAGNFSYPKRTHLAKEFRGIVLHV